MFDQSFDNGHPGQSNPAVPRQPGVMRGLPAREDVRALAETYLLEQHGHWPTLQNTDVLPANDAAAAVRLASAYEAAYRVCQAQPFQSLSVRTGGVQVGAAYVRYSDANSNSRSLNQQLVNVLRTARQKNVFIPWPFVFGDAAIPGTTTDRNGYQMLRSGVVSIAKTFDFVVVDDLDRLNRDQIESHLFIRLLGEHTTRLIATNGFDSADQSSKIQHSFNAMQNDFFNDQLKAKVSRGMVDAFKQGRNLGLPPLGYKVVPKIDADGNFIMKRNKKYETEVVIDETAAEIVRRIFNLYVEKKMSSLRIARVLNNEAAAGRVSWTAATIVNLLKNERFIGTHVWGVRKGVKNPRTGKRMDVRRPVSEHMRKEVPQWRIIADDLWQAAQRRLVAASKVTRPHGIFPSSRQSLYPTRLFDMYCKDCDRPLRLDRTGKYPHLCCANGKEGKPTCRLIHSKMLRTVDHCILAHLQSHFVDHAAMDEILERANAFLVEEAAKPPVDTVQIENQIQRETDRIKRLVDGVANLDDGAGVSLLMQRIAESQAELARLESEREMAKASNFRPQPIDRVTWDCLLSNLRDLLLDDVVASNAVLAKALGRVYVTQGPKSGAFFSWIAELNINEVAVLIEISKKSTCPTPATLDFLQIRSWTSGSSLTTPLNQRNRCGLVDTKSAEIPANTENRD